MELFYEYKMRRLILLIYRRISGAQTDDAGMQDTASIFILDTAGTYMYDTVGGA